MTGMLGNIGLSFLAPADVDGFVPTDETTTPDDFRDLDAGGSPEGRLPDPNVIICEICNDPDNPVPYGGRGRKPKSHKECRSAGKESSPRSPSKTSLAQLHEDLLAGTGEAVGVLMPLAPVTALTIGIRAEKGYAALITVAADLDKRGHPGMLNGLRLVAAVTPWMEVASFLGAIIYAVGVDAGQLSPESAVAEKLGVAEAARQVGWQSRHETPVEYVPTTVDGAFGAPPPPTFRNFNPVT